MAYLSKWPIFELHNINNQQSSTNKKAAHLSPLVSPGQGLICLSVDNASWGRRASNTRHINANITQLRVEKKTVSSVKGIEW